jgi:hypothetical protein
MEIGGKWSDKKRGREKTVSRWSEKRRVAEKQLGLTGKNW